MSAVSPSGASAIRRDESQTREVGQGVSVMKRKDLNVVLMFGSIVLLVLLIWNGIQLHQTNKSLKRTLDNIVHATER